MDSVALKILCAELRQDALVMSQAVQIAKSRLADSHPGHLEACGFQLNRTYNILEKMFERICLSFENHFEKRGDYHQRLIDRISLDIPGFRPAFIHDDIKGAVAELKGFRHVFRHAYDLTLRPDRLTELVAMATLIAQSMSRMIQCFESETMNLLEDEARPGDALKS